MNERSVWVCQNNLMHIKEAFEITYKFNFEWKLKSAMINTSLYHDELHCTHSNKSGA